MPLLTVLVENGGTFTVLQVHLDVKPAKLQNVKPLHKVEAFAPSLTLSERLTLASQSKYLD